MEISVETVFFFIIGLVIGGLMTFALLKHYYRRTFTDSVIEKTELTPNTLTLSGIEGIHSIEFNRDSQARLIGISMAFRSEATINTRASDSREIRRHLTGAEYPKPPRSLSIESVDDYEAVNFPHVGKKEMAAPVSKRGVGKMEQVKALRLSLYMETDKRTVEKEFSNLFDLRWFMDSFFSSRAERRSGKPKNTYAGPERRTTREASPKVHKLR
ncbi:MAG: hypothetical protein PVI20_19285 [Desulfobacteraceae bacterium]|jgi:hypothetical protein